MIAEHPRLNFLERRRPRLALKLVVAKVQCNRAKQYLMKDLMR